MKSQKTPVTGGILCMVLLLAIDQISKFLAQKYLAGTDGISLISGVFDLYYLENRGAAFGMFTNRQWFFVIVALGMFFLTAYVYRKLPMTSYYNSLRLVCILIAAGAVGNMIDRIWHKYVIDFLYFALIDFPVFNIADCYVCVGAALTVILLFTLYRDEEFEFLMPGRKS